MDEATLSMDVSILASLWTSPVGSTLLMLLGFGLVVLVHELGHFLVAKWVDIRVDEFAIGFGKKLWSVKWGETEYRLNMLPLGGYVKMPGQEDFALKEDEQTDPRAFNNKPIWARLCVVSAGVIMNVILAAVLFFIVFRVGKEYAPTVVGDTTPGYPAAEVQLPDDLGKGLQPGDVIEKIDGKPIWKFDTIYVKAILADFGQQFRFQVRRPGVDEPFEVSLGVEPGARGERQARVFGVRRAIDRTFADGEAAASVLDQLTDGKLAVKDVVVSVDRERVDQGWQITRMEKEFDGEPVTIEVRRTDPATGKKVTATVPPDLTWSDALIGRVNRRGLDAEETPPFKIPPFNILGLRPRIRARFVLDDSPADKAGLKAGDVIAGYGPAGDVPTVDRLRDISDAHRGGAVSIRVLRDGKITPAVTSVDVPDKQRPTIGITPVFDQANAVVAGVVDDTPLAGIVPVGAAIVAVNDMKVASWRDVINAAAALGSDETVTLTYETIAGAEAKTEPIALSEFAFSAGDYAYRLDLPFKELSHLRQERHPWGAVKLGVRETGDFIVLTYATLHGFFARRVPPSSFNGPIGIFRAGIAVGERGPIWVVWLLAIISANLAVINFLPLPIVDGGLAVMLIIEKIRGRPLSVAVQNAIQVIGLILIAVLFVLLTYNDIVQWIRQG